jgi:hypothetical protein
VTTRAELRAKWEAKRREHARYGSIVNAEAIIAELLDDLAELDAEDDELVTLAQAAYMGGYSVDHLQRLVASGKIPNAGRRGSPRIRRRDVPVRPNQVLPNERGGEVLSARRRMALAVINSHTGE